MRLIDADALKSLPFERLIHTDFGDTCVSFEEIDNAPTVEITEKQAILHLINSGWLVNHDKELREKWERPQGEWINKFDRLECPFCGMSIDDEVHWLYSEEYNFYFCPNCGARMKGGSE